MFSNAQLLVRRWGRTSRGSRLRAVFAAVAGFGLVVALAACGPPEEEEDTGAITLPDTTSPTDVSDAGVDGERGEVLERDAGDAAEGDGGDGTETCGGETCMMHEVCDEGTCVDLGRVKCDAASDEGMLATGDTKQITGAFQGDATDGLSTSCAGTDMVPERVYEIQVTEQSLVDVTTNFPSGLDAKVEFRRGDCFEPDSQATTCMDRDDSIWVDSPTTLYMIVENDTGGSGQFTVELQAKDEPCKGGTYMCASSQKLQYCRLDGGEPTPVEFDCPETCKNDQCTGASCGDPIQVTASKTYTGDLGGFEANMNFKNASGCKVGSPAVKPESSGPEVIFEVQLSKGDTLTVDTSGDGLDNLMFVTEKCDSDASTLTCVAAADTDSNGDDSLTGWTAPADGTYYVFVDKWSFQQGAFEYDFRIQ